MVAKYLLSIDLGTRNFAYCLFDVKSQKIIKWNVIELCSSIKNTHEYICNKLAEKLNELQIIKKLDQNLSQSVIIVIELQPKTNIRTILMSGQVQMYFVLEKINEKIENMKIEKIISYHARNKLKYYDEKIYGQVDTDHLKKGYYKNKVLSKLYCGKIIEKEDKDWIEFYASNKKKDDLADSYLQGLSYINSTIK